jgi:uncharacterized membrane protein YdbT with pleckstrin-like domain
MPKQLLAGESLAFPPVHRHWIVMVRGLAPTFLIALVVVIVADLLARDLLPGELRLFITVLAMAALVLSAIAVWVRWMEDALTVTDQRVILEEGVLRRSSRVIPLDRVQDVSTSQTLFGRVFNYGSVEIDAAGTGGRERFDHVASPERLRDQVFLLTERVRRAP